jgi:hypothetical protein
MGLQIRLAARTAARRFQRSGLISVPIIIFSRRIAESHNTRRKTMKKGKRV